MSDSERRAERVPTGVPGLDDILEGGLFKGSTYVVQGPPGSGKTILANQLCAETARRRGRALYVSLLAESFTGMLQHLRTLSFFDADFVGDRIVYLSGLAALEEGGLAGVLNLLRGETQRHSADVVVLDSLLPARDAVVTDLQYKRRLLDLQALGEICRFTTVLLTTPLTDHDRAVVAQMVDGVIELSDDAYGVRHERSLAVRKFRGSATLRGRHSFRISEKGLAVFPRLEAVVSDPEPGSPMDKRLSTGVATLDAMLCGGLPPCSTTGLIGAPGTCKTSLGLQFIAQCTPKEPALLFGMFESAESLRGSARTLGLDLEALEASGALRIVWQPQAEHLIDELGHRLLQEADAIKAKRVLLDGVEGLLQALLDQDRISRFLTALSIKLRSRGATVLITAETQHVTEQQVELPVEGPSPIFDNLIVMRRIEQNGRLIRLVAVIKVRSSDFDPAVHAFTIGPRGVEVGPVWDANAARAQPAAAVNPARADD